MPEPDGDKHQLLIAYLDDDSPIPDPVTPVALQVAGQDLATLAWILELADLIKVGPDAPQDRAVDASGDSIELW